MSQHFFYLNFCTFFRIRFGFGERRRALHPRVHFLVGILERDGFPELVLHGEIDVPAFRHRSARVWEEPQANGLDVHVERAFGDDWAVSDRTPQSEVLPHCGTFSWLHIGLSLSGQIPWLSQVTNLTCTGKFFPKPSHLFSILTSSSKNNIK